VSGGGKAAEESLRNEVRKEENTGTIVQKNRQGPASSGYVNLHEEEKE